MIYLEQFRFITFEKEDRFLAEYYQDHPWDKGSPYPFAYFPSAVCTRLISPKSQFCMVAMVRANQQPSI